MYISFKNNENYFEAMSLIIDLDPDFSNHSVVSICSTCENIYTICDILDHCIDGSSIIYSQHDDFKNIGTFNFKKITSIVLLETGNNQAMLKINLEV